MALIPLRWPPGRQRCNDAGAEPIPLLDSGSHERADGNGHPYSANPHGHRRRYEYLRADENA